MALKPKISKADLDALPEGLRAAYVERDGAYVLDAEGLVSASELRDARDKINEFRTNNVDLLKKLEGYKDIDVVEYQKLKDTASKLEKKGVKDPSELETLISQAVQAATAPLSQKLEAAEKAAAENAQRAQKARFKELVSEIATSAKAKTTGLRHILRDAEEVFDLVDDRLKPKDGQRHPDDPLKDLTPQAWVEDLAKREPFFFEASAGGDAPAGNTSGVRPAAKRTLLNPTAEEMGANMDAIIKGEVAVVRS